MRFIIQRKAPLLLPCSSDKELVVSYHWEFVTDPRVGVQCADLTHLFWRELEVVDVDVFSDVAMGPTPRDGNRASRYRPVQHDLHLRLAMSFANGIKCLVLPKGRIFYFSDARDWSVADGHDVLRKHEPDQLVLGHCRVQLNLVAGWLVAGVAQKISKHLKIEVGHSNALDESSIDQLL